MKDSFEDFEEKIQSQGAFFDHAKATHKTDFDKRIRELYEAELNEQEILSLQTINPSLRGKVSGRIEDTGQRIARIKRERKRAKSERNKRRR